EPVNHDRVRIGADERIREGLKLSIDFAGEDHLPQVFQIHLMTDAGAGGNHTEIAERLLAPAQENIALAVALVFDVGVEGKRGRFTETVDLYRVVDDKIYGNERIDLFRIAAQFLDGIAHGGQIDNSRNAGEVLHENARGRESDLFVFRPRSQRLDVGRFDESS